MRRSSMPIFTPTCTDLDSDGTPWPAWSKAANAQPCVSLIVSSTLMGSPSASQLISVGQKNPLYNKNAALKAPSWLLCARMEGKTNVWWPIKIPQQLTEAKFPSWPSPQSGLAQREQCICGPGPSILGYICDSCLWNRNSRQLEVYMLKLH